MPFHWLKKKSRPAPPPFWRDYLGSLSPPLPADLPLADIPFVVFDTETTGLRQHRDRLLSIGALRVQGWEVSLADSFEVFIRQEYEPKAANIAVHGILPGGQADRLEEAAALENFVRFVTNSVLVGHHVRFDIGMINAGLMPLVGDRLRSPVLDTGRLARRLLPATHILRPGELGLDALCHRYGIAPNDRHTAAGDAMLTALLLLKLLARLEERGVHTLKRLQRR